MKAICKDGSVFVPQKEKQAEILRHTAAHILAQAVARLYPDASFAYGPATEKGFYYDIDLGTKHLTEQELPAIEAEMHRIVAENLPIKPFVLPRDEALALMRERNEPYKAEHIADLPENEPIAFYRQGEYIDMCRGPHLTYTGVLGAFKLTAV